ncbi:hypothetical protein Pint_10617 [Pistacia integerrima]|uniref:Uncharacterized protein n=1 Tax=Pistacia integerrima TaxID=434235 RepID=A0ACC0XNN3_9ROSI|nr:hypothetical protein Pint_10617 [Pistacia integerrima]
MVVILLLLLLESAMAADILLNSDWEKDLPADPTGRFHDFKEFVKSNFDIFKWIGFSIILAQGSSTLLAMALRGLRSNRSSNCDSDDEYPPPRLPLLNHQVQPPAFVIGDPHFPAKNDTVKPPTYPWNVKIHLQLPQIFILTFLDSFSELSTEVAFLNQVHGFLLSFAGKQVKRVANWG